MAPGRPLPIGGGGGRAIAPERPPGAVVRSAAMRASGWRVRSVVAAAVAGVALAAAGCGSTSTDATEPAGTYQVQVVKVDFPAQQRLAEAAKFVLAVKNTGDQDVPNVAVTIRNGDPQAPAEAFGEQIEQAGVADPSRPIWVVDQGPRNGDTAYVNTWTLGKLRPGATRTFVWQVTAVRPGTHEVTWRVGAGVNGQAKAELANGQPPAGSMTVKISQVVPKSTVGPGGQVYKQIPGPDGTTVTEEG